MKLSTHFLLAGMILGFFGLWVPMPYIVLVPLGVLFILASIIMKIVNTQSSELRSITTKKEQF